MKPPRCFELGGGERDQSPDGGVLKRLHNKSRVSSFYGDDPSHTHGVFSREGYDFCGTFATTLLAQHLWGFRTAEVRDVLGLGTGREGVAPKGTETVTLVLKALNGLALARALLVAGG